MSKVPAFDAATIDGLITALRSPAVNVRAIGFEGLKARGAAAVNAVAALLKDPSPYMRGRAIYLLYQLGPEGRQRAGSPESQTDPGDAHRRLPGDAARESRRAASGGAARARHRRRRSTRGGAVDARPARRQGARASSSTSRAATTGRIAAIWKRWAPAPRARKPALYDRAEARARRQGRSRSTWSDDVRANRVAPARAGGGAGSARARAVAEAVDWPTAASRSIRSRSSRTRPRRRPCSASPTPDSAAARAGDVVAVEPHVQRLGGLRTAAGAQDGRHLRSRRRSRCSEMVVPPAPADLPELSIDEIARLTGDAARGKTAAARCLMCHSVGGTGAELGPALDGWGRGKSAEVIATALVRPSAEIAHGYEGIGAPHERRPDHPGGPDQGRRSADDAQHGRGHADHPRQSRRLRAGG